MGNPLPPLFAPTTLQDKKNLPVSQQSPMSGKLVGTRMAAFEVESTGTLSNTATNGAIDLDMIDLFHK